MITILVLLLVLLLALGGELTLRLFYRARAHRYVWPPYQRCKMEIDSEVFPALEPYCRLDVNSCGELGIEVPQGKVWRALAVGGSTVECYFLGSNGGWPAIIQREMNCRENLELLGVDNVHIGNVGKSGLNSEGVLTLLDGILPRYKPLDMIFVMVGAGDIIQWMANGAKDSGEVDSVITSQIFSVDDLKNFDLSFKGNAIAESLKRNKRRFFPSELMILKAGHKFKYLRNMRFNAKTINTEVGNTDILIRNYIINFKNILNLCKANSDKVIYVSHPWFYREETQEETRFFWNAALGHPFVETVDTYFDLNRWRKWMAEMDGISKSVSEDLGVEVFNSLEVVASNFNDLYDFAHLTNLGAEKLAIALTRQVLSSSADVK